MRAAIIAFLRAVAPGVTREVLAWLERRAEEKAETIREMARIKATAAAQSNEPVTEEKIDALNRRVRRLHDRYGPGNRKG